MRFILVVFPTCLLSTALCHLSDDAVTPSNRVDQYCKLAEACMHDTVRICGKSDAEERTFMDVCDMLEFTCDTTQIYVHIDDKEGCPNMAIKHFMQQKKVK